MGVCDMEPGVRHNVRPCSLVSQKIASVGAAERAFDYARGVRHT